MSALQSFFLKQQNLGYKFYTEFRAGRYLTHCCNRSLAAFHVRKMVLYQVKGIYFGFKAKHCSGWRYPWGLSYSSHLGKEITQWLLSCFTVPPPTPWGPDPFKLFLLQLRGLKLPSSCVSFLCRLTETRAHSASSHSHASCNTLCAKPVFSTFNSFSFLLSLPPSHPQLASPM